MSSSNLNRYPIPAQTIRIEQRVVNSRFIATIGHADSVEAAQAFVKAVRAEFADASHNVYAYKVGYGASITESTTDDGEPPGTAGRPALAVLHGADIGDVVVVVTRYFGGTKLGTGGLVRAYSGAVRAALEALPVTERVEKRTVMFTTPYNLYERVKLLIGAHTGELEDETFGVEVDIIVTFPVDDVEPFTAALRELSSGQIEVIAV
ncbi:MAG: YigZ family protein [Anaerolineae bacterium]|nr:YigZ family protein [Anaerolineae bacterium]